MQILFLPCAAGAEELLLAEIEALIERSGVSARPQALRGGCEIEVAPAQAPLLVMHLNLGSRIAQRVLWLLSFGPYQSEDDLYEQARHTNWCDWINPQQTLRVDVTAHRSPLRSLNFALLRVKDAVCDVVREATGERPSVDTRQPDLSILLHLSEDEAWLYIDTSGAPLFKRGWREDKGEAPLKETLAAALLAAAGWQGRAEDGPLFDPCCGSGTIAIEAAQIACGIAPGLNRHFAFEHLPPFAAHLAAWKQILREAKARIHTSPVPIFAGDVAFRLTDYAQRNAERAGVLEAIEFKTADCLQRHPPASSGVIIMNPPYGERIETKGKSHRMEKSAAAEPEQAMVAARDELSDGFYLQLAAHWKAHYSGWTAWLLSPDMKLPSAMRLKEGRRVPMWNGPIECRLFRFDMIAGSARTQKKAPTA